jgi:hypothetical protein
MTKSQFWILMFFSVLTAGLMASHLGLVHANEKLSQELGAEQNIVGNAQQLEPVLDRLAKRIAKGSDTDPRLKNVLAKYGLSVTLDVDGKKKNYP